MLIAGTIAAFLPSSSFTKEVHALSEYELMKRGDYNSKYVQYNKENIDCTNFNLNGNGLDINTIPESLNGLATASQGEIGDSESGISAYGTEQNRFGSYDSNKKDFLYKCINNNDNELIVSPTPSTPPPTPVDNVCTVWQDSTPGNYDIFFARSTDGGLTFSEPENISESPRNSLEPKVICEGNNVYVVWHEDITGTPGTPGLSDIFFARSSDGGLTFSEPENISENEGGSFLAQISVEGNNVYVVWQDGTQEDGTLGLPDIFFARSTDGGLTFSDPENISETTGESIFAQISSEGNNVYVVWQDDTPGNIDIFFARSTDGGLTFDDPDNISEENTENSQLPQISSEGNNVYVVWQDFTPGNTDIFFATSSDGGLTFTDPDNISESAEESLAPQISSEGNNVYVVWQDASPDNNDFFDIFFARSTDGGLTFDDPDNISETTGNSRSAQISVEGNNVYVVWLDETPGNADIFFARSTDGGLTFTEPENISENTRTSGSPQISSEGNNVYVVWIDASPNLVQFDIFFATSTDGGLTFSEPENISENTGSSINPQISSNTELQQQSTNDIITTTANNNNDHTVIKNVMEQKEEQKQIVKVEQKIKTNNIIQPKDITTNKNILEQKEQQKLAEEQKIQKSNVMSPPSLP
jgi:hypothetical protein